MAAIDSSIRRNAMRGMGWFVYVLGVVQILSILPSFFLVRGEGLERLVSLSYVLLSVLMGLIFVFIGYVFRKNLRNYLGGTIIASVAYVVIGLFYGMYVSAGPVDRVPGTYYLDPVLILSTVTLLPIWTGVMGVYEYVTSDHQTPSHATGRFRWLGVMGVAFVLFIAILLAGAPSTFLDPIAAIIVV
jgi:hypothetical protein